MVLHNKEDDVWVVVKDKVYDLTNFYKTHPAGPDAILEFAGKDGTEAFNDAGHPAYAKNEMESYLIGDLIRPKVFTKLEEIADHN